MASGLMQKTDMPGFSIMGLLLGGRGYASDWFSTRDKLALQQGISETEALNRANSVNTLMGGPQWREFTADPYSMEKLGGLWGAGSQANIDPKTAERIGDLFSTGMANIYGRSQQQYGQELTQENMRLGQSIAQQNIDYGARVDLETDRQKKINEVQAMTGQWKAAFGDNPQIMQSLIQGKILKDSGIDLPGETMPTMIGGQLVGVPIPGGKLFNETVQPVIAQGQMNQMIDTVVKSFDSGAILNQGTLSSLRAQISDSYRVANKAGALDEGLKNFLNELFPSNLDFYADPRKMGQYQEKWRTAKLVQDGKLNDMKKYLVSPLPIEPTPLGGIRPDAGAAADAIKAERAKNQQKITGPQSNPRFGAPRASGGQTGRRTLFDEPEPRTRTGGRY